RHSPSLPRNMGSSRRLPARSRSLPALRAALLALMGTVSLHCASTPHQVHVRDTFPLDPREELSGPFAEGVERGWEALSSGDAPAASRAFEEVRGAGGPHLAADIGWIAAQVLLGRFEPADAACVETLSSGEPTLPLLVACGEARGRGGRPAEGYRLYVRALARSPKRGVLAARAEELRLSARDALAAQARVAAEEHRWAEARDRIAAAIDVAPESVPIRVLAAEIENSAGQTEKSLQRYREAWDLDPANAAVGERIGDLAMEQEDYALAAGAFDRLARTDPKLKPRADEARLLFRVANWPPTEREAARAERLSRAKAASLVWWMFPEVREARVASGIIASDAVSRRDSRAFTRALALGLLEVDRETHRSSPDSTLTLGAASRLLLRLLAIVRPGEEAPCLEKGGGRGRSATDAIRAAEACGFWKEEGNGPPGGPAFTRALDRIRALAAPAAVSGE
ncbi:MAG: hypothetical protein LC796_13620, partial [Acidobacteria bacterium]|nr:hypothetical protein [Acidobacteriota bacterium]